MATIRAAKYVTRPPPKEYDPDWLFTELQNIQRGILPTVVRTETTDTVQRTDDRVLLVDCTGGARSVTLLLPSAWLVYSFTVIKTDASANALTLTGTVDSVVNPTITVQFTSWTMTSTGTAIYIE